MDAPVRLNSSGLEGESNAIASRLGYPFLVSTAAEAADLAYYYPGCKPKGGQSSPGQYVAGYEPDQYRYVCTLPQRYLLENPFEIQLDWS